MTKISKLLSDMFHTVNLRRAGHARGKSLNDVIVKGSNVTPIYFADWTGIISLPSDDRRKIEIDR